MLPTLTLVLELMFAFVITALNSNGNRALTSIRKGTIIEINFYLIKRINKMISRIDFGTVVFTSIAAGLLFIRYYQAIKNEKQTFKPSSFNRDLIPPLPEDVVKLLQASRLCFLATSDGLNPHLSLMNFTYYREQELIILCTKRNTKKFQQIMTSNNVAILIHDFPHLQCHHENSDHGRSFSITLNGNVTVCEQN